jgi:myo-inositol-1-phosphate synthase
MKTGLWLIGARGSLATTTTVGLAAMERGLAGTQGLVTEGPHFATQSLPPLHDIITGGHDISTTPLMKRAEQLADGRVFPPSILPPIADHLDAADARIRPGIDVSTSPRNAIAQVQRDLREFAEQNNCDVVIVMNVSSTEPLFASHPAHADLSALNAALDAGDNVLPISSLYAYAALDAGMPFVDFTPSLGARIPALEELAIARDVPHAGSDGKTGETLIKTTLAPMFVSRNLHVRSWAGLNLLGGGDGASLADPERAASKLESKRRSLDATLGYEAPHPVHIDYVEDLGDWKTAWNHISFEGFLGTAMTMQFTWQGCDSALAAPLVLDLTRLVAAAKSAGLKGELPQLAFFFKDPAGTSEHRIAHQFHELCDWVITISQ